MVFQHVPYFLADPDEDEDGYFNLPKKWRFEILEKLRDAGTSSSVAYRKIQFRVLIIIPCRCAVHIHRTLPSERRGDLQRH